MNGLILQHEVENRLRFKHPMFREPSLDFAWLQAGLERLQGVDEVRINQHAASVIIHYSADHRSRQAIFDFLQAYDLDSAPRENSFPPKYPQLFPMLTAAGLISISPLLSKPALAVLTLLNITPALISGIATLFQRGVKIEVLDAIAVGLTASKGSFITANITTFLMRLGEYLERYTEHHSDALLRKLLQPEIGLAWVERQGELVQVSGDQIQIGEHVVVGPGEQIAVDGLILEGTAMVNQASVTGEELPVRKESMDQAIAGTVLEEGRLRIEARHVGEETTTARIAELMRQSLGQPSATQRLAEKQANQRVYITLGTGAFIWLLTRQTRRLESIFLVDYSCALKLGTPVAFKSGLFKAAESSILFKGAETIEKLAAIDTVVFDKTGTLTHSQLKVTDVKVFAEQWDQNKLLAVTASIEEHASHPIAEAIVRKAKEQSLNHIEHGEADYLVAHGMRCKLDGDTLFIGSRHYLEDHNNISFERQENLIDKLEAEGKTLLYIATTQSPVGIIALRTTLRNEAKQVVSRLHELGVEQVVMLTGDRISKANAMASELGLDWVYAEKKPDEKAGVINELKAQGKRIAFVGDGVNDGPALMTADVGIAMPNGAELARATASVTLLEDNLSLLPEALSITQKTMQLIKTNYQATVGINSVLLLGAAAGWISPVTTSIVHNSTTLGVLYRALKRS